MAALAGACIGFLPYNLNPAKIFMGDTGSTFLGFILATVSIQGLFKSYAIISFAVPFLMLGLPIFDTCFAILRRLAQGQSPMAPDRGHIHHRLIDMGFTQKQAVAMLYVISAILGLSAVVLTTTGARAGHAVPAGPVHGGRLRRQALPVLQRLAAAPAPAGEAKGRQRATALQIQSPATTNSSERRTDPTNEAVSRVMTIFGTRPEAIKMAPLALELARRAEHREPCAASPPSTGRCWTPCWSIFRLTPDYRPEHHGAAADPVHHHLQVPAGHGGGAGAGPSPTWSWSTGTPPPPSPAPWPPSTTRCPVGHVEAGLRTYDKYSPFPEEMNRRMVGAIADLHFCPTASNRDNLAREGHRRRGVFLTGNTVIDALQTTVVKDFHFFRRRPQ